jgi:hypothetical protein
MNVGRGIGKVQNQDLEETQHPQHTNQRHLHTYDGSGQQR